MKVIIGTTYRCSACGSEMEQIRPQPEAIKFQIACRHPECEEKDKLYWIEAQVAYVFEDPDL